MQTVNDGGSMAPVTNAQLQQIRDSLEMAQLRLAALPKRSLSSIKAQNAVQLSESELTRTLTTLWQLTGTVAATVAPCASVTQVFGTPELLEMIFEHLHPLDLLRATQTCRATAQLLGSSSRIRKAMCLEADDDAEVLLPFNRRDDVDFQTSVKGGLRYAQDVRGNVLMCSFEWNDKLPRLGSRARSILVCVPPVKKATLSLSCCPDRHTQDVSNRPAWLGANLDNPGYAARSRAAKPSDDTISSVSGITVGDILAATQQRRDEHRLCPFADPYSLDKAGYVRVSVEFALSTRDYDTDKSSRQGLYWSFLSDSDDDTDSSDDEGYGSMARLNAYTKAKIEASEKGLRVPTLAEYDAQVGADKHDNERDERPLLVIDRFVSTLD